MEPPLPGSTFPPFPVASRAKLAPVGCAVCLLGLFFAAFLGLGLTAFLVWLAARPNPPGYSIVAFHLPPISNGTVPGGNPTARFTLEVQNKNKRVGVFHDDLTVTLSYGNRSGVLATVPGFYQDEDGTADEDREGGVGWVPWGAVAGEVAAKGTAAFRVGVLTGYRYKVMPWKGRRHGVRVGGDVEVDGQGRKKEKIGIRLSSAGAPPPDGARRAVAVAAAGVVLVVAPVLRYH